MNIHLIIDKTLSSVFNSTNDFENAMSYYMVSDASLASWEVYKQRDISPEHICNARGITFDPERWAFHIGFQYGVQAGIIVFGKDDKILKDKHCQIVIDKDAGKTWVNIAGENVLYVESNSIEVIDA